MDWKSLIADLQARGLSQPQIAEKCHCAQATISDLANGHTKEPRHSLGEALRKLHTRTRAQKAHE
jgi:transcriptional regulator with XRE-family HTH domain